MNPMQSYMGARTAEKLSKALKLLHESYLQDGIITDPEVYHMNNRELIHQLRKLAYFGLLIPVGESSYMWAGGENPNYMKLAYEVIELES